MNNINISSGIFFKKTFGVQSTDVRLSTMSNGIIVSKTIFKNQNIPVLLENNQFYAPHGLSDNFQIYEIISGGFGDNSIQTIMNNYNLQSVNLSNSSGIEVENRFLQSYIKTITPNINNTIKTNIDPYINNIKPQCSVP